MAYQFHERRFRQSIRRAMRHVRTILDDTRRYPRLAEEEDHTYDDKYALAEFLTNTLLAAQENAFERFLNLDVEKVRVVQGWMDQNPHQPVTLRFQAEDTCEFLNEKEVKVKSNVMHDCKTTEVVTKESVEGVTTKTTERSARVTTRVREFHWKVGIKYQILIFQGTAPDANSIVLLKRHVDTKIITSAGNQPHDKNNMRPLPEHTVHNSIDTPMTWYFRMISAQPNGDLTCKFSINRDKVESCKTPRRNDDIKAAVSFSERFLHWNRTMLMFIRTQLRDRIVRFVLDYYATIMEPTDCSHQYPSDTEIASNIFCPILPFMEKEKLLDVTDIQKFLSKQVETINDSIGSILKSYPSTEEPQVISVMEASIVTFCNHCSCLIMQYIDAVGYIEHMLRSQLIKAIGKEVQCTDFDEFMQFQNQKIFCDDYAPKTFTYAIRRPGHYPDGVVSIENGGYNGSGIKSDNYTPIETWANNMNSNGKDSPPLFIPINAATSVEIHGKRYLHGWMQHRFSTNTGANCRLACRARQFSSFMVIIGSMAGADQFKPKHAIILQNKDEVLIPLITNVLPSAKKFKDAIASLSPEQQEFAKAFRGMQLETSVFGVCVVQLRPQLEKLLDLPDGSLTKEIQLTQDLMTLFVEYQVPSDLLAFDFNTYPGGTNQGTITSLDKVNAVRDYVKSVMDVIALSKKRQLTEAEIEADMKRQKLVLCSVSRPARSAAILDGSSLSDYDRSWRLSSCHDMSMPVEAAAMARDPPTPFSAMLSGAETTTPGSGGLVLGMSAPSECSEPDETQTSDVSDNLGGRNDIVEDSFNVTMIPKVMDKKLEEFDKEKSLCTTTIETGNVWTRMRQENLCMKAQKKTLVASDIDAEKKKAFDLLDAISRSGTLPIENADVHIVIGLAHCFDKQILETVIEDNINPIAKVECSALLLASTIHGMPAKSLIRNKEQSDRLLLSYPFPSD